MSSATAKERMIRGLAGVQGRPLAEVARKCGVHKTMFYRVVKGTRTSARIDRIIARELGLTVDALRRCK